MGGGWPTATAAGGGCCAAEEEGGPAIRLKSLPLGFPDRGDGTRNAAAPPPITDCWAEDPCEEAEAVEAERVGIDPKRPTRSQHSTVLIRMHPEPGIPTANQKIKVLTLKSG